MNYYLGIDLGTSAVKMLLTDAAGNTVMKISREYPIYFPKSGWSEQNPDDWWDAVKDGIRELTVSLRGMTDGAIKGISFGGQMHGLVILDENDTVIRPAILWNDGRSAKECDYLNDVIGRDKLTLYTANIAFAGFTAPKLLWLRENEPANFKRIKKIMLPKDYIAYKLTGVHSTDYSDASGTLLLDVKHRRWSRQMLEICEIREDMLPRLFESSEVTGNVKPDVAKELCLTRETKVIAGAGDNAAAAIGTGAVGEAACNISLGTSGTVFISQTRFSVDEKNALHSFAHADGHYHLMGCILSAASCNKWWLEDILHTKDYAGSQKDIVRFGENHVYFLPYLMGERSPHNDPDARGVFFGMSMDTTRSDMTQAVLEGVSFALRDSVEAARGQGLKVTRSTVCGGGAKSPLWCRIIANVLDMDIVIPAKDEGPAFGAAILAAVGCKEYEDVTVATEKTVKYDMTYRPEPDLVRKYNARYDKYKRLYPAVRGLFGDAQ